jgi:phage recombination protein Bet
MTAIQKHEGGGLVATFAAEHGILAGNVMSVLKETIIPGGKATDGQAQAFLVVANKYHLDPFTKEIYAYPTRSGGIQPVIGIDGWCKLANSRPEFDGVEFAYAGEDEDLSCTCTIHRKDRTKPTIVTEYLAECRGTSEPWKKYPRRMLRHKAYMQCARYAFGFAGVIDEDEAQQMKEAGAVVVATEQAEPTAKAKAIAEKVTRRRAPVAEPAPVVEVPAEDVTVHNDNMAARLDWIEGARSVDAGVVSFCLGRNTPSDVAASEESFEKFKAAFNARMTEMEGGAANE